jgi:hypothetical protein
MAQEVVMKKVDAAYYAAVPELGVLEHAADADSAYAAATAAAERVRGHFRSAGAETLLQPADDRLRVRTWTPQLRRAVLFSVLGTLTVVALVGLTIANSVKRSLASFEQVLLGDEPARVEKSREQFRLVLQKYRPLIEEWQKATEKP